MSNRNAQEMIALLKEEKSNLELVNSDLLRRLEQKEYDLMNIRSELDDTREDTHEKGKLALRIRYKLSLFSYHSSLQQNYYLTL